MSADLTTKIKLKGSEKQLSAMLSALQTYDKNVKFESFTAKTIANLLKEAKGNILEIELIGPYGKYIPQELQLLEYIADKVPDAEFEIEIRGFITGAEFSLSGELMQGLLSIKKMILADEDVSDAYANYFRKKLPLSKFQKLFKVDCSEDDYADFFVECDGDIDSYGYDSFVSYWDDCCELDEDDFVEAVEKLENMEIMGFEEFSFDNIDIVANACTEVITYDPITHSYKGTTSLEGVVIAVTGSLNHFDNRTDFAELVKEKGGKVASDVTKKVNYLVTNTPDSNSSKNTKAKELGIEVITEEDFLSKYNLINLENPNNDLDDDWDDDWDESFDKEEDDVDCSSPKEFVFREGITAIKNEEFENRDDLRNIEIPDGVTRIGEDAFSFCKNLTSVKIPNSVKRICNDAFSCCSRLSKVTIGDGVTTIGVMAFYNCRSITDIKIPNSIKKISAGVFGGCTSLASIHIPSGVKNIEVVAFDDCISLTNISFEGTVKQWNTIKFGDNWNRNVPATEVICSDGVVQLN